MSETIKTFGVTNELVGSYVERPEVDGQLKDALKLNKQIIVYGSSKQGKSQLINKQISKDKIITIQCSPDTNLIDIYKAILRQSNIDLYFSKTSEGTDSVSGQLGVTAGVNIPIIAKGEASGQLSAELAKKETKEFRRVEYNLALAQDISEILHANGFDKYIVLENFHYLPLEIQVKFSFDLRTFQDLNVRFIILGIWRERNRLSQFNADLQDRYVEVAVEPWKKEDFKRVIEKGSALLNVNFNSIFESIVSSSFDSIGVFQELCKECCLAASINETSSNTITLTSANLTTAIGKKIESYSSRHKQALETFAEATRKDRAGEMPLFIPYYFIRVLLNEDFDKICAGLRRKEIHAKIKEIHHRPLDVSPAIMTLFFKNLIAYQLKKQIRPPLFDYDNNNSILKVIDSTLYFFLRHCDKRQILEDIPKPSEKLTF